ncbi:hypothetical protein AHF37_01865 [Paragonimus kellicotti]|nr:hypothetical protein AHF37_01865 [Paragonimus kellicotti]
MCHYQAFVDGSLRPYAILRNRTFLQRFVFNPKVQRTVIRFVMGLAGILILSRMLTRFPAEFMLTEEFQQVSESCFFSNDFTSAMTILLSGCFIRGFRTR